MNVTSVGTTPAPLPAPLPVSKPVATDKAHDAKQEAQQQAAQQARQPEKKIELPPLKPVSPQEFRVMLGALPVSVLSGSRARNGSFDLYA